MSEPADNPFSSPRSVPHDFSEEPEGDFELPIAGFQGTPEEIERQWLEKGLHGRGDSMRQLTWRAVLDGFAAGGRAFPDEPVHRAQGRLGIRRGHHGMHPLLCDLDRTLQLGVVGTR